MKRTFVLFVALLTSAVCLLASESITLSTGAELEIFQADAEKANGCAIIACPGGGYAYRADASEGTDWAPFMNDLGYTYAVLKYRLPKGNHTWPLADGRAAMKYLRDNAATLNIDPTHVGVMGCSAGGHLASTIATHTTGSERPAFQILFYPVITMVTGQTHQGSIDELLGADPSVELVAQYSNQLHVDANAPRAYITYSENDGTVVPATNGYAYYEALQAQGIPVSLKTYATGGHGWSPGGDKLGEANTTEMQAHFTNWLNEVAGILGAPVIPEGTTVTNASIDFSNAITDGVVTGTTNFMTVGAGAIVDGWLRLYDGTSTITIPAEQRAGTRDVVQVSFKMAWGNKNNMGSGFRIKDSGGTEIGSFQFARWDGSGSNSNTFGIDDISTYMAAHYNNAPILARYTQFTITVDYATKKITTSVANVYSGASKTFEVALTNMNPVATLEFFGYGVGGNTDRASALDEVKMTTTAGDYSVTLYDYTINYKYGEEVVKTVSSSAVADAVIDLDTYMWKDGVKYKKADSEPASVTIQAGDNTFDVAVNEAPKFNYQVKSSEGAVLVSGSYYEQESVTVPYPAFYLDGTDLYSVASSNKQYTTTFTLDTDNKVVTLNASLKASNVFYYSEGEDIPGATATSAGNNMVIRSSNAQCGYAETDVTLVTLPAGTYTATTILYANSSKGLTLKFKYDKNYDDIVEGASNGYTHTYDFTLTAPTTIQWLTSGDSKNGLDLIYITGTNTTYPATIGDAGWATLYTPYALDFSGVAGLTAYTATLNENIVTLTPVENVPANTGVVLTGAPGTYAVPVLTGSETARGDLAGSAVEAAAYNAIAGYDIYILKVNSENYVQFMKTTSGSVALGKAYLPVAEGANVKAFDVYFDGMPTGIRSMENGQWKMENGQWKLDNDGAWYDLSGRKIVNGKLPKGLYIVNGKKKTHPQPLP